MEPKPKTSRVSSKRYRCVHCGAESMISTNHYGEVYSRCDSCAWKRPGQGNRHVCLELVPEGMGAPEPWQLVKLGDICEIVAVDMRKSAPSP